MTVDASVIEFDVDVTSVAFDIAPTADVPVVGVDVGTADFGVEVEPPASFDVTPGGVPPVILVPTPGPRGQEGPTGPAGDNAPVFNETPVGVKDGANTVFTTADLFRVGSTRVTRNGLRESLGVGYSETGSSQVTFSTPPLADDELLIDYIIQ